MSIDKLKSNSLSIVAVSGFMAALVYLHGMLPHDKAEAVAGQVSELSATFREYLASEKARAETEQRMFQQQKEWQRWQMQQYYPENKPRYPRQEYYPENMPYTRDDYQPREQDR